MEGCVVWFKLLKIDIFVDGSNGVNWEVKERESWRIAWVTREVPKNSKVFLCKIVPGLNLLNMDFQPNQKNHVLNEAWVLLWLILNRNRLIIVDQCGIWLVLLKMWDEYENVWFAGLSALPIKEKNLFLPGHKIYKVLSLIKKSSLNLDYLRREKGETVNSAREKPLRGN